MGESPGAITGGDSRDTQLNIIVAVWVPADEVIAEFSSRRASPVRHALFKNKHHATLSFYSSGLVPLTLPRAVMVASYTLTVNISLRIAMPLYKFSHH